MAEYIDREELLTHQYNASRSNWPQLAEMVVSVEDIEDAPAADVAPGVWIPVTDRVPEVSLRSNGWGDVTVIATNGKFVEPLICERAIIRGKEVWRWKWPWNRGYDGDPVTHWMPLPKPPKGVSDNG